MPSNAEYMKMRRLIRRNNMLELLGGVCIVCGKGEGGTSYHATLEFDHIDRNTKSFNISGKNLDRPIAQLEEEVRKCQLLCTACHREKTNRELRAHLTHGMPWMYKKYNCRCEPCKKAYADQRRKFPSRKSKNIDRYPSGSRGLAVNQFA